MRLRIKTLLAAALAVGLSAVSGCQEPQDVGPAPPPGMEPDHTPKGKSGEALGEQGTAVTSTLPNRVKAAASTPPTPIGQPAKTASGLVYETLKEGTGPVAQTGQTVTIHYIGSLADGTVFDSSRKKGTPFVTPIGFGKVIGGWDEGVPGMKVGERRKLTIPPDLAYGPNGSPPDIPPNSTLTFDVELLDVK